MTKLLQAYSQVVGQAVIGHLQQLARHLQGKKVLHVNSTRVGGGVAEILTKLVPLMQDLGIDTRWEVLEGNPDFYACTKSFHNALQGNAINISTDLLNVYEETNAQNAEALRAALEEADFVFIHDPQPAPLLKLCPQRRGKWIWRCHIDVSKPYRPVWRYLRNFLTDYDASVFSLAAFAQPLPHAQYLVPPSIDPLSDKNRALPKAEIEAVYDRFDIDPERPMLLQVSRFDRFKDPVGVLQAYKLAKKTIRPLQLVLAGGSASDDPEGEAVLAEVRAATGDDPDVHILLLPPDAHREINALQRSADVVLQKSLREGFGLTVTEALWKGRPVIGGNTGGIRLQVVNHQTGFLVNTPEGAAMRIRYLLDNPKEAGKMGRQAHQLVMENFLITRHLREYLTLLIGIQHPEEERIRLA